MALVSLSDVTNQIYALINETSGASHFPADADAWKLIDQAVSMMAPIIELPRKTDAGTLLTQGMGSITLPTDSLLILNVYIGDPATAGDMRKLRVTREETLAETSPGWLETATASQGYPTYFIKRTETTGYLYPTCDANTANGVRKIYFTYVYNPAALTSGATVLPFPDPYNNIVKFYALYLGYLGFLNNPVLAEKFKTDFFEHHKLIQSGATKETREGYAWQWEQGYLDNDDAYSIIFR